ncbi:unnamed protein product [Brassica oleracea]|uniref:Uncharacterized protein n=1 Tax=Brassica oleracea TaxID=3712 RepID=A0A3P6GRJ3_BRAOL|nr:unnamed protein product [Brassica oleracea]
MTTRRWAWKQTSFEAIFSLTQARGKTVLPGWKSTECVPPKNNSDKT